MSKKDKLLVIVLVIFILAVLIILVFLIYKSVNRDYQLRDYGNTSKMGDAIITNHGCQLMVNEQGVVNCFGCSSGKSGKAVCKDPAPDFKPYTLPKGYIGIPYSCYEGPTGCELAQ